MIKYIKTQKKELKKNKKKDIIKKNMKGGNKNIQDKYFIDTYNIIKNFNINDFNKKNKDSKIYKLLKGFKLNILQRPLNFTPNYPAFIIINLFKSYISFRTKRKIRKLKRMLFLIKNNVYSGKIVKQFGLTNLTINPTKSLKILDSCVDEKKYCVMNPLLFINDFNSVPYICNNIMNYKKNVVEFFSYDPNKHYSKIFKIHNKNDLNKLKTGRYNYCITPDETLNLYDFMTNHSAGSCGQPVICAGDLYIEDNPIYNTHYSKKNMIIRHIDNSSGHYLPPHNMFDIAIDILKNKKLIDEYTIINYDNTFHN